MTDLSQVEEREELELLEAIWAEGGTCTCDDHVVRLGRDGFAILKRLIERLPTMQRITPDSIVVPREPTEEMVRAGLAFVGRISHDKFDRLKTTAAHLGEPFSDQNGWWLVHFDGEIKQLYAAILAATSPSSEGEK